MKREIEIEENNLERIYLRDGLGEKGEITMLVMTCRK